jgi:3-methyladenine DNA glycosylase/8-oxoguanine DNA glycosylase
MPWICGVKAVLKQPQSKRFASSVANKLRGAFGLRAGYRRFLLRRLVGHAHSTGCLGNNF